MLRKNQREEEEKLNNVNAEEAIKEENRGNNFNNENENENFSSRPRRKTAVKQYRKEHENVNENDSDNSNDNESDYDYDSESVNEYSNSYRNRNVRSNKKNISTQQIKNEYKDKDKDKSIVNINDNKEIAQKRNIRNRHVMKRHASQSTDHDMWAADSYVDHSLAPPSAKPLFNWEHVLLAVQDYADSLLKLNSSNITVRTVQLVRTSHCVS